MNIGTKLGLMALIVAVGLFSVSAMAPAPAQERIGTIPQGDILTQSITYHGHVDVYKIPAGSDKRQLIDSKDNMLVTNGKTYIRTQVGSGGATGSSSASYLSLSNDGTAPDAAWTDIPSEIVANGLERAQGTYAANGTGAWNYTKTWTATGAQSAQLVGLNYGNTANDATLFAAVQLSSATLATNDQLQVIYSISVS